METIRKKYYVLHTGNSGLGRGRYIVALKDELQKESPAIKVLDVEYIKVGHEYFFTHVWMEDYREDDNILTYDDLSDEELIEFYGISRGIRSLRDAAKFMS